MKSILRKICLLGCLLSPIGVSANPVLFEDFSSTMSEQKFNGTERMIEVNGSGELSVLSRAKSFITSIPRSNSASLQGATNAKRISADLKVTNIGLGNSDTQQAILRIFMDTYDTQAGRVSALLNIGDRGNGLEVWYEVSDDAYEDGSYVSSVYTAQGSLALDGLSLDTTYPVSIVYDGDTGFTFQFNNEEPVTAQGPAKIGEPSNFLLVGSRLRFGQNNSTPEIYEDEIIDDGTTAFITGTIDNVTTDIEGLADDFNSVNLEEKWFRNPNSTIINEDEKLEMAVSDSFGNRVTQRVNIDQQNLKYFGAKVTLSSKSMPSENARLRARITHYLGNDTYDLSNGDTANGFEGNLWTQIVLDRFADGTFRASAYLERASDANYTMGEEIFFQVLTPTLPVAYDVEYELAIEQVDKIVNYKVDGETLFSFDLTSSNVFSGNLYEVTDNAYSQLNARIQDGPGKVVAIFDDIITDLMPATITLNGTNSDDEQVVLPEEVVVNVGEEITLTADSSDASDVINYIWQQTAGTNVDITSANVAGNTISFMVPEGSDTEDLDFELTTVSTSGLETKEQFSLAVDNSQTSTLSSDTTPEPEQTSSSGGGSFNSFLLLILFLAFSRKVTLRSNI